MEKEDKITCRQCGKSRPKEEMKQAPITFIRSRRCVTESYWFCRDSYCAGHYQMGTEG